MLTEDELAHARESAAFQRLVNERTVDARRLLIDYWGLSPAYSQDPIVDHAFRFYLKGAATFQGAMLLAYRALRLQHDQLGGPLDVPLLTLETIEPAHVIELSAVCAVLMQKRIREARRTAPYFSVPLCA